MMLSLPCVEQRIPASKNCHNVQHGARTLVRSECRLCQCQNGRLDSCIQLSRSNCSSAEPCFIRASNGHVVSLGHGMRGSVDCRQCVCNNGKYDCKAVSSNHDCTCSTCTDSLSSFTFGHRGLMRTQFQDTFVAISSLRVCSLTSRTFT